MFKRLLALALCLAASTHAYAATPSTLGNFVLVGPANIGALGITPGSITGFSAAVVSASPVQGVGPNCTLVSHVVNCTGGGSAGVTSIAGRSGAVTLSHLDITDWNTALTAAIAANPSSYITAAGAPVQSVAGLTGSPSASAVKAALAIVPADVAGFAASASSAAPVQSVAGLVGSPSASQTKTALAIVPTDVTGFTASASAAAPVQGVGTGCSLDANRLVTCTGSGGGVSVPPSVPFLASSSGGGLQAAAYTPYNAANPAGYIPASGAPVQSVAGLTGAPTATQVKSALAIVPSDVTGFNTSAAAASPVQSVAGLTGAPTAAQTKTALAIVPADITGFNASAASAAPVQTVAGRSGSVVVTTADLADFNSAWATQFAGALGTTSGKAYPGNNPSAFITSAGAPVQTVAGRSGAVVLSSTDISNFTSAASAAAPIQGAGTNCSVQTGGLISCVGGSGGLAAPSGTPPFLAYNGSALVPSAYTPENIANRNAINGYAGLDGTGDVPATALDNVAAKVLTNLNTSAYNPGGLTPAQFSLAQTNADALGMNLMQFGAHMDGVTSDCPAWNAAIDAQSQQWTQYHLVTPLIIPIGHGRVYLNCTSVHHWAQGVPGIVIGPGGHNSAVIQLGASFNDAVFQWSNNTIGLWPNIPGTVPWDGTAPNNTNGGGRVVGVTCAGVRPTQTAGALPVSSSVMQTCFDFRDNNKQAFLYDDDCYELPGSCIRGGYTLNNTGGQQSAVLDESDFSQIRSVESGLTAAASPDGASHPPFDFSCTGSGDCFNQIHMNKIRGTRNYSECGVWVHANATNNGARQIHMYSIDMEDTYGGSGFCIGSPVDTAAVTLTCTTCVSLGALQGHAAVLITGPATATTGAQPRGNQFMGLVAASTNPAPLIDIETGQNDMFTFQTFTETQWTPWVSGSTTYVTSAPTGGQTLAKGGLVSYQNRGYQYTNTPCAGGITGPTGTSTGTDGACNYTYLSVSCSICGGLNPSNSISGSDLFMSAGNENGFGEIYLDSGLPTNTFLTTSYQNLKQAVAGSPGSVAPAVGTLTVQPGGPGNLSNPLALSSWFYLQKVDGRGDTIDFQSSSDSGATFHDGYTLGVTGTGEGVFALTDVARGTVPLTFGISGNATLLAGSALSASPATADNSTKIATTAMVQLALAGFTPTSPVGNFYVTPGASQGGSTVHVEHNTGTTTQSGSLNFETWDSGALTSTDYVFGTKAATGDLQLYATGFAATPAFDIPKATGIATMLKGTLLSASPLGSATDHEIVDATWVSSLYAPLSNPVFTGTPTAPTPATADSSTTIPTTAFVKAQGYAPLASPALTGVPTAPTASPGTNTTQLATMAAVQAAVPAYPGAGIPVSTGSAYGTSMAHTVTTDCAATLTVSFDTPGVTDAPSYTAQNCKYSKIGAFIQIHGTLVATMVAGTTTAPSGNLRIGLPVAVGAAGQGGITVNATGSFTWPGTSPTQLSLIVQGGASYMYLAGQKSGAASINEGYTTAGNCLTSCTINISFNGSYDTGSGS